MPVSYNRVYGNVGYDTVVVTVSPLGINELKNIGFKVYPNPAKDRIYIEGKGTNEIKLFDVLGNEILNAKEKEIDVSSLKNGVYFVQVKTDKGEIIKKIIIQR
jgi:hypothetical protein